MTASEKRASRKIWKRTLKKMLIVSFVGSLGIYIVAISTPKPNNLGVSNGKLSDCLNSSNCVSTQTESLAHRVSPIPFTGTVRETTERIKHAVEENCPGAILIAENDGYLHYEVIGPVLHFVDDVEFFVNDNPNEIHFRAASRISYPDFGVNRRRMSKLAEELSK